MGKIIEIEHYDYGKNEHIEFEEINELEEENCKCVKRENVDKYKLLKAFLEKPYEHEIKNKDN